MQKSYAPMSHSPLVPPPVLGWALAVAAKPRAPAETMRAAAANRWAKVVVMGFPLAGRIPVWACVHLLGAPSHHSSLTFSQTPFSRSSEEWFGPSTESGDVTPAAAMGDALIDRLVKAGITFELLDEGPAK
jgi:hypothetical protein